MNKNLAYLVVFL